MKSIILNFTVIIFVGVLTACGSSDTLGRNDPTVNKPIANESNKSTPTDNKKVENKSANESQKQLVEIFDGRETIKENLKFTETETVLIEKEVRLQAKEEFLQKRLDGLADGEVTKENFSLRGVAEGSFTKPAAKQKAYLYRYSYTNGIVLVEDGKIIGHYSGDPGDYALYFALKSLPDINKDGLSELVLFRNVEDNEDVYAYLFAFKQQSLDFMGEAVFFSSDYQGGGDVTEDKAERKGFKVTVEPSINPVFFRETYQKIGEGKWSLAEKNGKFSLEKRIEVTLTKID